MLKRWENDLAVVKVHCGYKSSSRTSASNAMSKVDVEGVINMNANMEVDQSADEAGETQTPLNMKKATENDGDGE